MAQPGTLRRVVAALSFVFASWCVAAGAQDSAVPAPPACAGQGECLCDDSYQDCRAPILELIKNETVGIDVSFWFMNDARYANALIARWKNKLPVRVIVDTQADPTYAGTKAVRDSLVSAGIPIRNYHGPAINHWKMMLFVGQGKVEFSAANYADGSYSPSPSTGAYRNYVDEAIYFTDDPAIVNSFMTRFEDNWVSTTTYVDFANITTPPARKYPLYSIAPDLNFVPDKNFEDRLVPQVNAENTKIDAVIFRITSPKVPDALIARAKAGVPIRVITEERQYRNPERMWHAYNIDRMYMAGITVKVKDNVSEQDVHQKSIILYTRGQASSLANRTPMVVFGSSNWTSPSAASQQEHNYFTTKTWMVDWFTAQFERKWNNLKEDGTPIGANVYIPFTPLPPETPVNASPANDALGLASSVTLKWEGGYYAHKYDIYVDTTPNFTAPPVITDYMPSFATSGVMSAKESFTVSGLLPGTTYYWKIVGKTMANLTKTGPTWHFTTSGGVPPPPAPTGLTPRSVSYASVDLSWTDVAGEEGYKVERKLSADATWVQIGTTAADVVGYLDAQSGLKPDTAYDYRVRAYTSGGNSGYSNTLTVKTLAAQVSPSDVVLYAAKAPVRVGAWNVVADSTAAGGQRLENVNAGAAKVTTASATPSQYFEMTFNAAANTPYRLWLRGKAALDQYSNDSVFVQFSGSVTKANAPVFRIGTTSATDVNLEDCSGCGLSKWGWQDNGWGVGVLGPEILFETSGPQTLRIQPREDGLSIDQIVLSPGTFLSQSPGSLKNDAVIMPEQNPPADGPDHESPSAQISTPAPGATVSGVVSVTATATDNIGVTRVDLWIDGAFAQSATAAPYTFSWDSRTVANGDHTIEAFAFDGAGNSGSSGPLTITVANPVSVSGDVILYAADAATTGVMAGAWRVVADSTAAGNARINLPNAGAAKVVTASATPTHYFELTFNAEANTGYRLWVRGKADGNDYANDSVHVQFSRSVTSAGAAIFRIGTTSSTEVNLEDCSGCGLSGWGWQDNGWGVGVLGPEIYFETPGPQTIRIQAREDGLSIDQIVLSPARYVSSAPGSLKNDTTILPR